MERTSIVPKKYITVLAILLLYVNEDLFIFGTYEDKIFETIKYIVQISLFLLLVAITFFKKITIFSNKNILFFILCLLIVVTMLLNLDFRLGYFFMILIIITCFLSIHLFGIDNIFEVLYKSMTIICLFSVVLFFLSIWFPNFANLFSTIKNVNGVEFYSEFFVNILVHPGGIQRNFGPFREPGVFQMFIIISIIYGLFKKKNAKVSSLIIQIIALLTTLSTTGYIAFFFIIIALLFDKKRSKNNYIILVFSILSIIFLLIFTDLLYKEGYGSVFGKLLGKYDSISLTARKASIFVNLKMFLNSPLFGNGLSYVENNYPLLSYENYGLYTRDNTNTLLIQLSRYGIFYFSILLFGYCNFIFKYFKKNNKSLITKIFIILSIMVLLLGENLTYSFLFSLLMIIGLELGGKNESTVNC